MARGRTPSRWSWLRSQAGLLAVLLLTPLWAWISSLRCGVHAAPWGEQQPGPRTDMELESTCEPLLGSDSPALHPAPAHPSWARASALEPAGPTPDPSGRPRPAEKGQPTGRPGPMGSGEAGGGGGGRNSTQTYTHTPWATPAVTASPRCPQPRLGEADVTGSPHPAFPAPGNTHLCASHVDSWQQVEGWRPAGWREGGRVSLGLGGGQAHLPGSQERRVLRAERETGPSAALPSRHPATQTVARAGQVQPGGWGAERAFSRSKVTSTWRAVSQR